MYDAIVIGGGFYGLRIAQYLRDELGYDKVKVIEKGNAVMSRASYNNQARIHNGYHYPRSILTALRSRVNQPYFCKEYPEAVYDDFDNYYGVAKMFSKVSPMQFERFYDRVGAPLRPEREQSPYLESPLIEKLYEVEEVAFNTMRLKEAVMEALKQMRVEVLTGVECESVEQAGDGIRLKTSHGVMKARSVINATYSGINHINRRSRLPIIPLKHELTEMCLVTLPKAMERRALTLMCGPFFSIMPFPAENLYTLSHVRYTPHTEWYDREDAPIQEYKFSYDRPASHFKLMLADLKRYVPAAAGIQYSGRSLWEVKTVLPQSESDDSRPILYRQHHGNIKNYTCIMGGKIDNVYDVFKELRLTYA